MTGHDGKPYLVIDRKKRVVDGYACILPAMESMRSWGTGARVIRPDGTVLAVMISAGGGKVREKTKLAMDECVQVGDGEAPPRVLH